MPSYDVDVSNFSNLPRGRSNGTCTLNLSRRKCLKFATTVGNSHFSQAFGQSQTALALAAYRAAAVRCVIDFNQSAVQPLANYAQLESTEKVSLSYWIGMTFAAIAAADVLDVPRLIHASKQSGLKKVNQKSKSLADLVGTDTSGMWHVIEAKGRQTQPSAVDKTAWKQQAQTVSSINQTPVATCSYCLTLMATPLTSELKDPPPSGGVDLRIDPDELGSGYYRSFIEFLRTDSRRLQRGGRNLIVRPLMLDPVDNDFVYLGLDEGHLLAAQGEVRIPKSFPAYEDDTVYVGADGVVIATSAGPCDFLP